MDREVGWEVDFGKYFDEEKTVVVDDGIQEEVVNSESAINIGTKVNSKFLQMIGFWCKL
jgi:hypothetical protein